MQFLVRSTFSIEELDIILYAMEEVENKIANPLNIPFWGKGVKGRYERLNKKLKRMRAHCEEVN